MYSNPPSLHTSPPLNNSATGHLPDDFARRQRHLPTDGFGPRIAPARHHQQDQRDQSTTCVPSLVPHGVDPEHVDVRTFYPYQPNEVKHRKRTTRPQLKILEDVYSYDTKPNAGLRKKLAEELGMTPRGVQVWFQNRRAKQKNLARKAELAAEGGPAAGKKAIDLNAGSSSTSSPSAGAASSSSSPTPVSSNPSRSGDASSSERKASSSGDAVATPPPRTPSPSSSPLTIPRHPADADESPFMLSPPVPGDSSPSSHSSRTPTLSAAELLAQRRPSLPILSVTPSASSQSAAIRTARASIHGGGSSGMLSISHRQGPHGFDPTVRRGSMDTNISTNIKRLSAHPYAHLARGTNDRFHGANPAHIHGLASSSSSDGPGRLDGVPGGIGGSGRMGLGLRHGSMPHVFQSPANGSNAPQHPVPPTQDYLLPGSDLVPPRRRLQQKHSMPAFNEHRDYRQIAPSLSAGYPGGMQFTNPFASAPATSANLSAGAAFFDSPVSPLTAGGMQPPPSPSSTSPPPISHSLNGSYPHPHAHAHGLHVPSRVLQPPIPGPLPEPSFSFGDPSASPSMSSSASSSPPSDHSTVVDAGPLRRASTDSVGEGDDASAASSSAYDPLSRYGSFASVGSESSWTSYWSEAGSQGAKESGGALEAQDGFERRGSYASVLGMFNGLDVTDGGTPQPSQPFAGDGTSEHQEMPAQAAHDPQDVYAHVYQDKQDAYPHPAYAQADYAPHEHHMVYPATGQDPFAPGQEHPQGVYAMDKSAMMMGHAHEPQPQVPQSHASELAFALHSPGSMPNATQQHPYALGYADSAAQGSAHPPPAPEQLEHAAGKDAPYAHEPYEHAPYPQQQLQTHYDYSMYAGTPVYDGGAVELGSMCVPASMSMDGMGLGDYVHQYA